MKCVTYCFSIPVNGMIDEKLLTFLNNENNPTPETFSLENIKKIMKEVGNPHLGIKTIHVAGTNGKGSVVGFLGHMFYSAGYRTGCYTSPHLKKVNERIQVNETQIDDIELENIIDRILDVLRQGSLRATYFDILTAASFIYFEEKKVDVAIIETGLGGRLDSTNIITPLLSIITSISFDHMEFLGETLSNITGEKAGIIKAGIPVVTCNTEKSIIAVLKSAARQQDSAFHRIEEDFNVIDAASSSESTSFTYKNMRMRRHYECRINTPVHTQAANAGCALYAVELLLEKFPRLKDLTLGKTISTAKLAGRFVRLSSDPLLVFDPAHNEAGIISLYHTLKSIYKGKKVISVITIMEEKNTHAMIETAVQSSEKVYYLLMGDKRNYAPQISDSRFYRVLPSDDPDILVDEIEKILSHNAVILFTGSFRIFGIAETVSARLRLSNFKK